MSPGNRSIPGSAEDWLARAKADLALAKIPLPAGALYEDLCFHAQQAAEKALKAVYQRHGWRFRYVHDLQELLAGLREKGLDIPDNLEEAATLTIYAFGFRHPGLEEPVTREEYELAVTLAERVVQWAASQSRTERSMIRGAAVGLVEPGGGRTGLTWHLSAAAYRRLGEEEKRLLDATLLAVPR